MASKIIPHSRPTLTESDRKALVRVLRSGYLSQGPLVQEFEEKMAQFIGKKGAAAVSSGSAALHLALAAMGVKGRDDEVIIPSFVCSAVLNAVYYVGGTPIIVDIEPQSFNISVDAAKCAITQKTKAMIVPHMFGCPAEMDRLLKLGIPIIEDCAQAAGATFLGQKAGSLGHVSAFSFYSTKVLTTGEGGMVISDSEDLIARVKDLREYDEKEEYALRFNYKMADIGAALGLGQLSQLEKFIAKRREIAVRYFEEFKNCSFSLPLRKEGKEHIYYRFVLKAQNDASHYLEKFQKKNVICRRPVYRPLHSYFNLAGFPQATEAWQRAISIPLYPSLTGKEIEKIVAVVKEIF